MINIVVGQELGKPMAYNVGGLQAFDEVQAQQFLVEVLGRRENLPLELNLDEGTKQVEQRMRARYGATYRQDCARLLKHQLESSDEDQEIWESWRTEYLQQSILRNNLPKVPRLSPQDRASGWLYSAESPDIQPTTQSEGRSIVIFPAENDFETRVNNFLGSKVPTDLSIEPQEPSTSSSKRLALERYRRSSIDKLKRSLSGILATLKGMKPS